MHEEIFDRIDFNEEWMKKFEAFSKPDDPAYWDGRADNFAAHARVSETGTMSSYLKAFLEYLQIEPGESVFDMGCGPGTTSLPLARAGHEVIAADFSPRMLHHLSEVAAAEGISQIKTLRLSWEDDWDTRSIPQTDLAIASRSIASRDLGSCIRKLEKQAYRRVCFTISASSAPMRDEVLLDAIGRKRPHAYDFEYCVNILFQMGILPEIRYIDSLKCDSYPTAAAFEAETRHQLGPLTDEEEQRLQRYLKEHMTHKVDETGEKVWLRDYPLHIRWAFISWNRE